MSEWTVGARKYCTVDDSGVTLQSGVIYAVTVSILDTVVFDNNIKIP